MTQKFNICAMSIFSKGWKLKKATVSNAVKSKPLSLMFYIENYNNNAGYHTAIHRTSSSEI